MCDHLSWNTKYNTIIWVTFIVEYKIQPIMCNIYCGIQNTTLSCGLHLS